MQDHGDLFLRKANIGVEGALWRLAEALTALLTLESLDSLFPVIARFQRSPGNPAGRENYISGALGLSARRQAAVRSKAAGAIDLHNPRYDPRPVTAVTDSGHSLVTFVRCRVPYRQRSAT